MPTIYLLEGPVGAGKSTLAAGLARTHQAPHLNLDEWMVTLFQPDRPADDFLSWYAERKDRCIDQLWLVARELLDHGTSVVLELGLVRRSERAAFYQRTALEPYPLEIYVLEVDRAQRLSRVQARNKHRTATFQMTVDDEIFALADAAWEAPDLQEQREQTIHFVTG